MRRVLAIFVLASGLFGVNLVETAHSQTATPAGSAPDASIPKNAASLRCSGVTDNRAIRTLGDILSCISAFADGPEQTINYFSATDAVIRFIDNIDHIEYCSSARDSRGARLALIDEIRQLNEKVNAALATSKDSDYWVLDRSDPPSILLPYKNRLISPAAKSKKMTETDVNIERIITILSEHKDRYSSYGDNEISAHEGELYELSERVLNWGNDLSEWGMDAFLTSARGYAIYQFVRNCTTSHHFSLNIARAYAARTAAESEQYFYAQVERLVKLDTAKPALRRWENDKILIEESVGREFPTEIYLGTNVVLPEPARGGVGEGDRERIESEQRRDTPAQDATGPREGKCKEREKPFENWYGKLAYDPRIWENYPTPDKSGFSSVEVTSECEKQINSRNWGAISTLMTARLQDLGPTSDLTSKSAETRLGQIAKAINNHISSITFQKLTEECLINTEQPCPQSTEAIVFRRGENIVRQIWAERPIIVREFSALGAMSQAVKDILARRSLLETQRQ
jgi:hypothetical protein